MLVRFKGKKEGGIHVMLPVGVKRLGLSTGVAHFNPCAELEEADAMKLIQMHPDRYEIIKEGEFKMQESPTPIRRRGRPKKTEQIGA